MFMLYVYEVLLVKPYLAITLVADVYMVLSADETTSRRINSSPKI